jgi:flagellar biosynthesis/type III secretory pathway protein FliH
MLVTLPGRKGRHLQLSDRRIPADKLKAVLAIADIEQQRLAAVQEAREWVRAHESGLRRRMCRRAVAKASLEAAKTTLQLQTLSADLTGIVIDTLSKLLGPEHAGAWQAQAALQIASSIESLIAVEVAVAPQWVQPTLQALESATAPSGTFAKFRVVPDSSMQAGRCVVRCGPSAWIVELDAWLRDLQHLIQPKVEALLSGAEGQP